MSKFAVLGFGTVGSGVVELFYKNQEQIEKKAGKKLDVKYILDLREFPDSPYGNKVVHDINTILEDDEVTVVAECMGGQHPAFEFVSACLKAGKSVCTSNKELVAEKGDILLEIAKEQHCNFFFEASVGGAIPIIRPLYKCLAANDISAVHGILNGTTNFILESMFVKNMAFADALAIAQEKGYAEKDPTADIEGHDACRKICILSSLVFGSHVYPSSVAAKGISSIDIEDVQTAQKFDGAIKLIAGVERQEDGKILPYVMPMFVPDTCLLSHVDGVFNAAMVSGDGIGTAVFYGKGAGKLPTASAVLGDMIDAAKHHDTILSQSWVPSENQDFVAPLSQLVKKVLVRFASANVENAVAAAKEFYAQNQLDFADEVVEIADYAAILPQISQENWKKLCVYLEERDIQVCNSFAVLG